MSEVPYTPRGTGDTTFRNRAPIGHGARSATPAPHTGTIGSSRTTTPGASSPARSGSQASVASRTASHAFSSLAAEQSAELAVLQEAGITSQLNLANFSSFSSFVNYVVQDLTDAGASQGQINAIGNFAYWMENYASELPSNPADLTSAQISSVASAEAQYFGEALGQSQAQINQSTTVLSGFLTLVQQESSVLQQTWGQGQGMSSSQVGSISQDFANFCGIAGCNTSNFVTDSNGVSYSVTGFFNVLNGYFEALGNNPQLWYGELNPFGGPGFLYDGADPVFGGDLGGGGGGCDNTSGGATHTTGTTEMIHANMIYDCSSATA